MTDQPTGGNQTNRDLAADEQPAEEEERRIPDESALMGRNGVEEEILAELARAQGILSGPPRLTTPTHLVRKSDGTGCVWFPGCYQKAGAGRAARQWPAALTVRTAMSRARHRRLQPRLCPLADVTRSGITFYCCVPVS